MTAHVPRLPFSLDPLVAEAKRRARQRRVLVIAVVVVVVIGAVAGTTLALRPGFHSAAATKPTGTIFGGILPGGTHGLGHYAAGAVTVSNARGKVVATVSVMWGRAFRLRLHPGVYELRARYADEPCIGHTVVRPRVTRRLDIICQGK
jgi:hypothetical protein